MLPAHLLEHVIKPTLIPFQDMWSPAAGELLLGTCAVESDMGEYLVQLGGGPALGIYQMEPFTHNDIWDRYLKSRVGMAERIKRLTSPNDWDWSAKHPKPSTMVHNLAYATIMARLRYWPEPSPLPAQGDWAGHAHYWELYYNRVRGHGTLDEPGFLEAVRKHLRVTI